MIFNKDNNGAMELRELTGSYFANNDFSKIIGQVELVTEELKTIITPEVYAVAESDYKAAKENELIRKVQLPIAILSTLRMYQRNDLSHEDDGRKFKKASDNTEVLPWEWQLDRDDRIHLEDYYRAVDALIRYLNDTQPGAWINSATYKQMNSLLIRSGREFEEFFPIESSERTYILLVPFIKEAQLMYTKKQYGIKTFDKLLAAETDDTRWAACKATALMAVSIAMRRMRLSIFPEGVIQQYLSQNGGQRGKAPTLNDIRTAADWLQSDANDWLNEMKRLRDGGEVEYNLLPKNDRHNKYMRL